ncbi:hypothetical protein ACIBP6_32885 [Nonomuraea terrae]|uniref:hypothetical protein n=1 Tax=Nonomuraea terrae TaxID=2530383 RepID=UPI0037B17117
MSRAVLAAWLGALCAAVYPTWERWRPYVGELRGRICFGSYFSDRSAWQEAVEALVVPLRADAGMLVGLGVAWGVPAVVVLAAFGRWQSAVAGRRAAALLALTAVLNPLVVPYFDSDACAVVPLFSGQWFAEVAGQVGSGPVLALLVAAVLVLLATQLRDDPPTGPAVRRGRAVRRAAAVLIDYWVIALPVTLVSDPWEMSFGGTGLLERVQLFELVNEPAQLIVPVVAVLYVLPRRTLGIWVMGLRRDRTL